MILQDENIAKQIGNIIKSKRKSKKLTQKGLSIVISGTDELHTLISRVENGAHKGVPFDKVHSILLALEIDILELITNTK